MLINLALPQITMSEIFFKDLSLHSPNAAYPPLAHAFKKSITDAQAILFVTRECNRSVPDALKNAIDLASRLPERMHLHVSCPR